MAVTQAAKGIFVSLLMGLTSYFGSLTLQCTFLWLAFISPKLFRKLMDLTMFLWISTVVTLMENILGIKFRLFGDMIRTDERAIIIMNHRTRLDWLYFYGILFRCGWSLKDEKIILKDELKLIPGAGWAMQCGSYIFLRRKLENDKKHLSNVIEYLCKLHCKSKILIFPEGTDFSNHSRNRSHQFAEKMGLVKYEYVLHPRTAGFVHTAIEMRKFAVEYGETLDAVYDITVGYPGRPSFATNEIGFALGRSSPEVHFQCKRYALSELLPQTSDNPEGVPYEEKQEALCGEMLRQFVVDAWTRKEDILRTYYENPARLFPELEVPLHTLHDSSGIVSKFVGLLIICGTSVLYVGLLWLRPCLMLVLTVVWSLIISFLVFITGGIDEMAVRWALGRSRYRQMDPNENSIRTKATTSVKQD